MAERMWDRQWAEATELVGKGQLWAATVLIAKTFGWLAHTKTPEIRENALVAVVLEAMKRQHEHDRSLLSMED
jgi:hypothetical protein